MVTGVVETPSGYFIPLTGETIPYDSLKLRSSGDSDFHICGGTTAEGRPWTRCLYVPGRNV